jgi:hypothetical protein
MLQEGFGTSATNVNLRVTNITYINTIFIWNWNGRGWWSMSEHQAFGEIGGSDTWGLWSPCQASFPHVKNP